MVDLHAGTGLIVALHDGWGAAVGALDGDRLILGAVTLTRERAEGGGEQHGT